MLYIGYPYLLSKCTLSCGGGGGDGDGEGGSDALCCVWFVIVFVFVIESLEFTVFVFDLFYKEVSPFNTVSMVVIELLMVSHPISNLWILVFCLCFGL